MTIAVDLGRKATKTNKQSFFNVLYFLHVDKSGMYSLFTRCSYSSLGPANAVHSVILNECNNQ